MKMDNKSSQYSLVCSQGDFLNWNIFDFGNEVDL